MRSQALEDCSYVQYVIIGSCAAYEEVIEIDKHERESFTDSVHEALEGLCCVFKAKWCTQEFEKAKWRDGARIADARWSNMDLMRPTY